MLPQYITNIQQSQFYLSQYYNKHTTTMLPTYKQPPRYHNISKLLTATILSQFCHNTTTATATATAPATATATATATAAHEKYYHHTTINIIKLLATTLLSQYNSILPRPRPRPATATAPCPRAGYPSGRHLKTRPAKSESTRRAPDVEGALSEPKRRVLHFPLVVLFFVVLI
jgi:hypothetical protein